MTDLELEALVLCLLLLVRFLLYVVQNRDLLLQVSLYISTLRLCYVFNSVLLTLELPDLFPLEEHFLSQLLDVLLQLVDGGLEAERLLKSHLTVLLAHD